MRITKIDNSSTFKAGSFSLINMQDKTLGSIEAIKNIAQDRNLSISISRNISSKYLPKEDLYSIIVLKELPIYRKNNSNKEFVPVIDTKSLILNKKTKKEELSVKIYNAVMMTIESLNKKISEKI